MYSLASYHAKVRSYLEANSYHGIIIIYHLIISMIRL